MNSPQHTCEGLAGRFRAADLHSRVSLGMAVWPSYPILGSFERERVMREGLADALPGASIGADCHSLWSKRYYSSRFPQLTPQPNAAGRALDARFLIAGEPELGVRKFCDLAELAWARAGTIAADSPLASAVIRIGFAASELPGWARWSALLFCWGWAGRRFTKRVPPRTVIVKPQLVRRCENGPWLARFLHKGKLREVSTRVDCRREALRRYRALALKSAEEYGFTWREGWRECLPDRPGFAARTAPPFLSVAADAWMLSAELLDAMGVGQDGDTWMYSGDAALKLNLSVGAVAARAKKKGWKTKMQNGSTLYLRADIEAETPRIVKRKRAKVRNASASGEKLNRVR